jgi:DNA-binding response OmpR family regulator
MRIGVLKLACRLPPRFSTIQSILSRRRGSMATMQPMVLLIVEDDREMRNLLCDELWDMGYRIVEASDGDEALQRIEHYHPDVILTDLRMPAGGLDYVIRLRMLAPGCPIILMTAFGDVKTKTEALQYGVTAYFDKPVRISELKAAIKKLMAHSE